MIEFKRAELEFMSIHHVGNNANGEPIILSERPIRFTDTKAKKDFMGFFNRSLKGEGYYQFRKTDAVKINDVFSLVKDLFEDPSLFHKTSLKIANKLYEQGVHPSVKSGELLIVYFSNMMVDGEESDAIGLFKTEQKDDFIKFYERSGEFDFELDSGYFFDKADKAALILNSDQKNNLKVVVYEKSVYTFFPTYWTEDFLNLTRKHDSYFKTQSFLDSCKNFCEDVLTPENNVSKLEQQWMINRSMSYLLDKEKVELDTFETEVIQEPEMINAFREYRDNYNKINKIPNVSSFEISEPAIRSNKKYLRSVLKLDKNFHVYVHAKHDTIERGYDEEKGMHFYKLYFNNEE
jgi:hypothetical protein